MRAAIRWLVISVIASVAVVMSNGNGISAADLTRVYVGSYSGDTVTVIDIGTLKVVAAIKVGQDVHGICAAADERKIFVTVEATKMLVVIDTATNKIVDTIPLTGIPNQCAVTPDGHYLAVPVHDLDRTGVVDVVKGSAGHILVHDPGAVDIVDIPRREIVQVLPMSGPHNCFTAGNNDDMYCESRIENTISRIDLKRLEYDRVIPTSGDPRPFAISKDEKKMYVALSQLHGFEIINLSGNRAIQRVELPPGPPPPSGPCEDTPTHGLALTPDGKELWVTSIYDSGVYVYDIASTKVSKMIPTGGCPNWIAFSADGKYTAVSGDPTSDVSIIDTKARKEIARILLTKELGKRPKRVLVVSVPAASE
jgi:YVTN family beta-propeller protein